MYESKGCPKPHPGSKSRTHEAAEQGAVNQEDRKPAADDFATGKPNERGYSAAHAPGTVVNYTQAFPTTLRKTLNETTSNPVLSSVIRWNKAGTAFAILDKKAFVDSVLSPMLHCTKIESFTRKLNRWGFRRVSAEEEFPKTVHLYHEENFHRDYPELAVRMKTRQGGGRFKAAQRSVICRTTKQAQPPQQHAQPAKTRAVTTDSVSHLRQTESLLGKPTIVAATSARTRRDSFVDESAVLRLWQEARAHLCHGSSLSRQSLPMLQGKSTEGQLSSRPPGASFNQHRHDRFTPGGVNALQPPPLLDANAGTSRSLSSSTSLGVQQHLLLLANSTSHNGNSSGQPGLDRAVASFPMGLATPASSSAQQLLESLELEALLSSLGSTGGIS